LIPLQDRSNADNFIGYPIPTAAALKETLTNAACPGETSTHFIDLTSTNDNGCGPYRQSFPLHVAYSTSQLDYADTFLQSHPKTLVVSIDIGVNDLFVLETDCGGASQISCILNGLPGMLDTLSKNLDTIYEHIRNTDGYHHKLVALTYYSLNYSDTLSTGVIERKAVLDALRKTLRRQNYSPIVFDFERPASQDSTETVSTLAHLARFMLVDLTAPSSAPYAVATIIPQTFVPVQPLLTSQPLMIDGKAVERREYAMFENLTRLYDWVLPTIRYQDKADLIASLLKYSIKSAEQKAQELAQR
jgi:hypothetical protein